MEVIKFKATQEPIKALYGRDAKAAFLTLKARGSASDSTVTCKVETGRGLALAGIHPKAGGTGQELCSGDMLLEALIACAGVSMRAAAAVLEIPIRSAVVSAEGDVDLRGTLGVTDGVPVGFKEIRLRFDVDSDATQDQLDQLIELTDRYCVIFQTIQNSPRTIVAMNKVRHRDARSKAAGLADEPGKPGEVRRAEFQDQYCNKDGEHAVRERVQSLWRGASSFLYRSLPYA